jgi:cysteine desulfurase
MTEIEPMIYLDYAASTPVEPRVAEAMSTLMTADGNFANPSSTHRAGRQATARIEQATEQLASLVNTEPRCLVWTSGATESDNLAIIGGAMYRESRGRHLISMKTEHKAVTDVFVALGKRGYDLTWLEPAADGVLDPAVLRDAIRDDTQLVSIMHVNNETGVIQDIAALGEICRERNVLFHVDAAQSLGKLPIDLTQLPVDLMSMTAHKVYGPKGIGALYIADRPGVHIQPQLFGGGQQRNLRPGTQPAHQIAGFGMAAAIAEVSMQRDFEHLADLRERMWSGIADLAGIRVNGSLDRGFPGILNVSVDDIEGESLLLALEPLCVATGSACNSKSRAPSYVLRALGCSDAEAQSAIRFSFGRPTTTAEIDFAVQKYRAAVGRLRALAPEMAA